MPTGAQRGASRRGSSPRISFWSNESNLSLKLKALTAHGPRIASGISDLSASRREGVAGEARRSLSREKPYMSRSLRFSFIRSRATRERMEWERKRGEGGEVLRYRSRHGRRVARTPSEAQVQTNPCLFISRNCTQPTDTRCVRIRSSFMKPLESTSILAPRSPDRAPLGGE